MTLEMGNIPYLGEICGLLTAILWSGSSIVFSAATTRVGPMLVNVSRLGFALCFLVPVLLVLGPEAELKPSQLFYLGASGVVGLAIGDSFLYRAYRLIGPRISMLVMSLSPAIAALLAFVVLHEKTSVLGLFGMAVTLSGIAIVVSERRLGQVHARAGLASGVFLASLSAVFQGVSLVLAKLAFLQGTMNGFVATAVRVSIAFAVLLPVVVVGGRIPNPLRIFSQDRRALLLTLLGSILGPFLGIAASLMAVAYAHVGIAATLMSTVPIIMLPLVRILFKEQLTKAAIGGAFIAVAGVALLFLH